MGKQLIHVRNSVILFKPGLSGQDFQLVKTVTEPKLVHHIVKQAQ